MWKTKDLADWTPAKTLQNAVFVLEVQILKGLAWNAPYKQKRQQDAGAGFSRNYT